jgi:hypothetical protein
MDNAPICTQCGTQSAENVTAVKELSTEKKSGSFLQRNWKVLVPAVVAVLVIAVGVTVIAATAGRTLSPAFALSRAFTNFGEEATLRLDNTPFTVFGILSSAFEQQSTLTVDFDYNSGFGIFGDARGSIDLASDFTTNDLALTADITLMGLGFDLAAYINSERAAVRSRMIGNDFYGFSYDTFRQDIQTFGPLIGLDGPTMNLWADYVDIFADMMRNPLVTTNPFLTDDSATGTFGEIFSIADVFRELDVTTERVDIDNINAYRVEVLLTHELIMDFLQELYDYYADFDDADISESFEAWFDIGYSFDEVLVELREGIAFLQEYITYIHMNLTFYVERDNDRLFRMEFNLPIEVVDEFGNEDHGQLDITVDLGRSVHDQWRIILDITDDNETDTFTITWDYRAQGQRFENTFAISFDGEDAAVTSVWSQDTGRFTLAIYENRRQLVELGGILNITHGGDGFNLSFDPFPLDGANETLTIGIAIAPYANIGSIDFINLDQWDAGLLDTLFGLFFAF